MIELNRYLASEAEQTALAEAFSQALGNRPLLVFLQGDLGAGKTTFVRGFIRAKGYAGAVRSPTYTLLEPYELPGGAIYHLDLYRLCDPEELEFLGLREILDGHHQVFIEWPQQGAGWLPAADMVLDIRMHGDGRQVLMRGLSREAEAVLQQLK